MTQYGWGAVRLCRQEFGQNRKNKKARSGFEFWAASFECFVDSLPREQGLRIRTGDTRILPGTVGIGERLPVGVAVEL
jgi:hypothetical protein